ncbi:hypothetical protein [Streptomyces flaveus]|nr:hypothetical protein [Streptomyces flaveus]
MEVKAAATVKDSDFAGGVVINLGKRSYTYEDRLHVLPLGTLWR